MRMPLLLAVTSLVLLHNLHVLAEPFNTFDGPGFPACHNVKAVYSPASVDEMASIVREAAASGTRVRASGKRHMWYDTMCSDEPNTIVISTEGVHAISDFDLPDGADEGSVVVEAGVASFPLASYLHDHGANVGNTLVNWNVTLAASVAMGSHRSSLREHGNVAAGVLSMDIIDGKGDMRTIVRDEDDDEWLAASTSLGLLGIIARMKFRIYRESSKVYSMQKTLSEEEVLEGDMHALIAPYATANFWWWPFVRKFHYRYYDQVPIDTSPQEAFQSTFSLSATEAIAAKTILDSGKVIPLSNMLAETTFFQIWEKPNFRDTPTGEAIDEWPVYGWNHDVIIGGLYPDQSPEWDYGLRAYTLELAAPMTMANAFLKRVRELIDEENAAGRPITSTYRSGINIKFGKADYDFLGQVTYNTSDGADWTKGAIMLDFPSYRPSWGDHKRWNEPFYHKLAKVLIDEFPCRPHWTKNTREVFEQSVKNLDKDHIARFKAVRERFDSDGIFTSVVGEIIGVY